MHGWRIDWYTSTLYRYKLEISNSNHLIVLTLSLVLTLFACSHWLIACGVSVRERSWDCFFIWQLSQVFDFLYITWYDGITFVQNDENSNFFSLIVCVRSQCCSLRFFFLYFMPFVIGYLGVMWGYRILYLCIL